MSFTNETISPEQLPTLHTEPFQTVERAWLKMRFARWALLLIPAIGATVGLAFAEVPRWAVPLPAAALVAFMLAGMAVERRAFPHRGWLLRTRDISSRQGLITRHATTAPFTRVQHVTVSQGAFARLFGVAQLNVFTAGAGLADLIIQGLSESDAERLKTQIIEQSDRIEQGRG